MNIYNYNDIKEWYKANYKEDKFGDGLYEGISWSDLWEAIVDGDDVYDFIGVCDSLVRERLFGEIAEQKNLNYDFVYFTWTGDYQKALKTLYK